MWPSVSPIQGKPTLENVEGKQQKYNVSKYDKKGIHARQRAHQAQKTQHPIAGCIHKELCRDASANLGHKLLGFLFLPVITLFQHFVENAARPVRITHVDVSASQVELGPDLITA